MYNILLKIVGIQGEAKHKNELEIFIHTYKNIFMNI